MGKQPAVVIIVRHGARLDAADKSWHLTSPTPYDPPLTYGGWSQCQALGSRIASILKTRREDGDLSRVSKDGRTGDLSRNANRKPRRAKNHKVVIHSSPFIRCIQTSIAIGAGIGSFEIKVDPNETPFQPLPPLSLPHVRQENENGHFSDLTGSSDNSSVLPAKLKVDAFLGEWLSPDYYENITPPPGSIMMVASAKADLLRPSEEIRGSDLSASMHSAGMHSDHSSEWAPEETGRSSSPIPFRSRAITYSASDMRSGMHFGRGGMIQEEAPHYSPPIPNYAISASENIPLGYVAHARDACIEVDYQWDSMREPLEWGDGGEYGEEWTSMHRRFRNGLQKMLDWYQTQPDSDNDTDLVLILVTHGAGCNALIGAMTSAPVLLDVGMASLTMAVRKEPTAEEQSLPIAPTRSRRGSIDLGLADEFDMKIIASTEHLRPPANPLGLNSPRLGRSPAFASKRMVGSDSADGFSIGDPMSWRPSSSGGLGRSSSQRSFASGPNSKSSTGLWRGGSRYSRDETAESSESDTLPKFERAQASPHTVMEGIRLEEPKADKAPDPNVEARRARGRIPSQPGLWGSEEQYPREENKYKRRWTFVESS